MTSALDTGCHKFNRAGFHFSVYERQDKMASKQTDNMTTKGGNLSRFLIWFIPLFFYFCVTLYFALYSLYIDLNQKSSKNEEKRPEQSPPSSPPPGQLDPTKGKGCFLLLLFPPIILFTFQLLIY